MSERHEAPRSDAEFTVRMRGVVQDYGSANAMAKAIGRSEGAVRKWLRGESAPNVRDVRTICEQVRVNVEWLVTGRGRREAGLSYLQETPPAAYQNAAPTALSSSLLERVLQAVEEESAQESDKLPPAKRSLLVTTLYGLFRESDHVDRETVARLVRLAT